MNITIFIGGLYGGGAERVACNLANYFVNNCHNVEIISMAEDKDTYYLDDKVVVTPLIRNEERKNPLYNAVVRFMRLRKYMKNRTDRDAYIVMLPITTIMMLMFRGTTKAKVVVSERVDPNCYPSYQKFLLKKLAKRADAYVFQTKEIRNWYGSTVADSKANIISNAINEEFIRPAYSGEREKNIVAVGRLNKQKNFGMLIDAFATIEKDYPEYTLTIYGKGAERENLENQVKNLGIADKVLMPGQINNIGDTIQSSSLFVLSSDYEGMPNALMEALALGLPCVSTDCGGGGAKALIEDGENGVLIHIGDCDELISAMRKVLDDKGFAEKISKNAVKVQEKLSPEVIYGKWEEVVTNCML